MTPSTQIVPFWHRLRAISTYPTRGGALWTLIALTLASAVLYLLPFGFVVRLMLSAAAYAYAVLILRNTANGRFDAPEVNMDGEGAGYSQIALQFVFIVLMFLGFLLFGVFLGSIVAIALALAMPGATISLAMDDNFGNALNPAQWWAIASRLGWPYLALAGLSAVIVISQANAQAMLEMVLGGFLAHVASYFVSTYAVFATFHLMGYVIYQYHEELGHEIAQPAIALRDRNADPDQDLLDEAAQLVLDGDSTGAEQLLARRLAARGGTAAVHTQYRKLLRLRNDAVESSRHGREYLNILMQQGQQKQALDLVKDCLALDPDFEPLQPEHILPLARRAAEIQQTQVAVQLTEAFAEYHPGHPDVAANAMIAAKLLAEKQGDERRALAVLKTARATLGPHPEIDAYLQFLDKLLAPMARA
jgi:hypothetical protein